MEMNVSAIRKYAGTTSVCYTFPTSTVYDFVLSHIDEFYDVLGMDACERIVLAASRMEAYRHVLVIPDTETC